MNMPLVSLELRKNRLTLAGLAAAFALVPPLSVLFGRGEGRDAAAALEAGLILWTAAGLPLAAVFFGATAGAGLRSGEMREAEAPFPGSPAARLLRGLAGALLQFLLLALATGLISAMVSPGWRGGVLGTGEAPAVWANAAPLRGLLVFLAFDLLTASFFASYALDNAVAGGLLGVALSAAQAVALGLGLGYQVLFSERAEPFVGLAVLAAAAGLAAKLAAARPLAARFERARPLGAGGGAAAALLLAAGALVSWSAEECAYARVRSSLRLLKPGLSTYFLYVGPSPEDAHAAVSAAARGAGALATDIGGGLVSIRPDGRPARLLPGRDPGRLSIFRARETSVQAAAFDDAGRLFVQRRVLDPAAPSVLELDEFWIGRPAEGLRRIVSDRGAVTGLERQDEELGVSVIGKDGVFAFCGVRDDGRVGACAPRRESPDAWALEAVVSKDGTVLSRAGRREKSWRLPGRAAPGERVWPFSVNGRLAYFVEVREGDDQSVAICREDGSVQTRWKHSYSGVSRLGPLDIEVLPDGTLVYQYAYEWNVVDPAGDFPPKIRSKKLFERWPHPAGAPYHTPRLVHRAGGRAWIVFEAERLVEMDESTGMPLKDWPLPARWNDLRSGDLRVLESGLLVQAERGSPRFIAWDGTVRALRAP